MDQELPQHLVNLNKFQLRLQHLERPEHLVRLPTTLRVLLELLEGLRVVVYLVRNLLRDLEVERLDLEPVDLEVILLDLEVLPIPLKEDLDLV